MTLDKKDEGILGVLKGNSRTSIRDIAKATKLRPSTVHQRMVRMIRDGTIERFTVQLDDDAAGEAFRAYILVTTSKDFDAKFFQNQHLKEVCGVTGEYDLLLKLKFKDVGEFNSYLLEFRKNPCVEKTLTMVVTTKIKEEV